MEDRVDVTGKDEDWNEPVGEKWEIQSRLPIWEDLHKKMKDGELTRLTVVSQ